MRRQFRRLLFERTCSGVSLLLSNDQALRQPAATGASSGGAFAWQRPRGACRAEAIVLSAVSQSWAEYRFARQQPGPAHLLPGLKVSLPSLAVY